MCKPEDVRGPDVRSILPAGAEVAMAARMLPTASAQKLCSAALPLHPCAPFSLQIRLPWQTLGLLCLCRKEGRPFGPGIIFCPSLAFEPRLHEKGSVKSQAPGARQGCTEMQGGKAGRCRGQPGPSPGPTPGPSPGPCLPVRLPVRLPVPLPVPVPGAAFPSRCRPLAGCRAGGRRWGASGNLIPMEEDKKIKLNPGYPLLSGQIRTFPNAERTPFFFFCLSFSFSFPDTHSFIYLQIYLYAPPTAGIHGCHNNC